MTAAAAAALALLLAPLPPRLLIEAPRELAGRAAELERLPPARLEGAMRLVGLSEPGPPIRVLLAAEGSPAARAAPSWVAGYALGAGGPVVLFPARTPAYPDGSLEELLGHEVAHVLIDRAAPGAELPRWFQEGLATVAGGSWGLADRSRLVRLDPERGGLAGLDRRFAGGPAEVERAYAFSAAFVRSLMQRHGRDAPAAVLAEAARGLPFAEAFARATGESLAAAEAAFWRRHDLLSRWLPLLTSSLTLWLAVAALALWAARRRRARAAALMRQWREEEERAPPLDG
ncbi:MAG TPA: hypothetical protein VF121_10415 [Thermoanaerobaculia bacterium]|nr:hypothetical protein [Thermoanaerobaculia bacterium]